VKLQRHAVVPLSIRHFEQIDLRHRVRNVHERISSAEAIECAIHDFFGGSWFAKVERKHETFSCGRLRLLSCLSQMLLVPRDQCQSRKIPRQSQRGGSSDSLAGPGNDSHLVRHRCFSLMILTA
jgi:hypothetical protein